MALPARHEEDKTHQRQVVEDRLLHGQRLHLQRHEHAQRGRRNAQTATRGGRGRKEMLGGAVHAQGQGRDICLPHHVDKAGLPDGCQVRFLRQAEEAAPPAHHLQHQQGAGFLDDAPHADGKRADGA